MLFLLLAGVYVYMYLVGDFDLENYIKKKEDDESDLFDDE